MGWLVKAPEPVNMRLPSLGGGLNSAVSRQLDGQEAHALRVELMRRNVQDARVRHLGQVGETAETVVAGVRYRAIHLARLAPEALSGLDMIAVAVEMGCAQLVGEMAR